MRYTPFENTLNDLSLEELEGLKDVREGWYVEYKSQLPNPRDIAKSISSFANQYGGWLFIGIDEDPETETAQHFPGIEIGNLSGALEAIRNAAKDIVRPQISYQCRTIDGPNESIGLNTGKCVVIVHIPEGANTPYIHNDGRIYIRIGDSSSPVPAKDKSTFDALYRRGEERRALLKQSVERSPTISKSEQDSSYIHLSVMSDPYETLGYRYRGTYSDFCNVMAEKMFPFDNVYTSPDGFVARQAKSNDRYHRLLTWEFSRNCNSFITIPISTLSASHSDGMSSKALANQWKPYSIGLEFMKSISSKGLERSRILNLNMLLLLCFATISRHRIIVGQANLRGPFYIKARLENVWRTIPFIDLDKYMVHVNQYDIPVVQASDMVVPPGSSIDTFIISPELDHVPVHTDKISYDGPVEIWLNILEALGIPMELIDDNATALLRASMRESEIQRARSRDS